ncbi:MAG: M28 family metallopeptidase [Candidatus Thorarchaeota archaeon]
MRIEVSKEDSDYMYKMIQDIIDQCGPRMPCSPSEAKCAKIIESEFKQTCDDVTIEPFICQPRAFLGFIKIITILIIASLILFLLTPLNLMLYWEQIILIIIVILNIISILILWNEFFNYNEFIDPVFRKGQSQNVIGKVTADEEVKRILIFSAHHDSALQFNLLTYLKIGYIVIIVLGLFIMVFWSILSVILLLISLAVLLSYTISIFYAIIFCLLILSTPIMIGLFLFVPFGDKANKVPGAVDNLSAVAVILAFGKILKKNRKLIPPNTEVRLISFGCEEAGLRGAYRYVEKHLNELRIVDAECINMDAIQSNSKISIIDYEPTTRTRHSDIVVKNLIKGAEIASLNILKSGLGGSSKLEKVIGQLTGSTDATAFSKAGIKAASITAMDLKQMLKFYHQPSDTPDKIEKGSLENILKLCIEYLKIK